MGALVSKPFNWARQIINAVFHGSPNLITAEDLNRQIVALKKECFLLQQGNRYVNSDFQIVRTLASSVVCSGTYVFIEGMKIAVDMAQTLNITWNNFSEYDINLYATKTLVQFSDDASHQISGAVFVGGDAYEAADHYVYENAQIAIVQRPDPNGDFEYPQVNSKDYVCTLCRIHYESANANATNRWWVNNFCKQPSHSLVHDYEGPTQYRFYVRKNNAVENHILVPGGNTALTEAMQILWSRLYNLERRLFLETSYNNGGVKDTVEINGTTYNNYRHKRIDFTGDANWSNGVLEYWYYIVGNICFVLGYLDFGKLPGTAQQCVEAYRDFNFTGADGELPHPLVFGNYAGGVAQPIIATMETFNSSVTPINRITGITGGEGAGTLNMGTPHYPQADGAIWIYPNKIRCMGFQRAGYHGFYAVYPFSSHRFWSAANIDGLGNFDDHK